MLDWSCAVTIAHVLFCSSLVNKEAASISEKQQYLVASIRPAKTHTRASRYPGAWADVNLNLLKLGKLARKLEEGTFMADHKSVLNIVTPSNQVAALNVGRSKAMEHGALSPGG